MLRAEALESSANAKVIHPAITGCLPHVSGVGEGDDQAPTSVVAGEGVGGMGDTAEQRGPGVIGNGQGGRQVVSGELDELVVLAVGSRKRPVPPAPEHAKPFPL